MSTDVFLENWTGERRNQNALSQNTQHRKTCQLFNDNQRVEPNPWLSCLFQHSVNSTYLTAYHNVYLCINSNFFLHSLTCTRMTDYSVVHKTFMHLLSELWPNSYIHTVLPTEVRQRHQMLSRRMKSMLLAPLTLAPCRWAKHPRSKTTMATLMRQTSLAVEKQSWNSINKLIIKNTTQHRIIPPSECKSYNLDITVHIIFRTFFHTKTFKK